MPKDNEKYIRIWSFQVENVGPEDLQDQEDPLEEDEAESSHPTVDQVRQVMWIHIDSMRIRIHKISSVRIRIQDNKIANLI